LPSGFQSGKSFSERCCGKSETDSLQRLPARAEAKMILSETQRQWLAQKVKEKADATPSELQESLSH